MAQLTPEQLQTVLEQTLSPYENIRRNAEHQLDQAQKVEGHPLAVLRIVANSDASNAAVRQAAAVHFKNIIKHGWDEHDSIKGIIISQNDRNLIKSHLVELMCTTPPNIQAQCSEAISLIAAIDFPDKWDNLLPELVQRFNSPENAVVNGVLATANSIFKRFRDVERSDELYRVILYVLQRIQAPLLTLFKSTGQAVDAFANDKAQLAPRFESLRLMCRIFYSLNYQDLPEFFEDHMEEWMAEFAKYLEYQNPILVDVDEDTEPGPMDKLQAAIVQNINLYTEKDEEPFLPFLSKFTTIVWNLLLRVTDKPKHDILATTCICFLSSLVKKQMHRQLFQDPATLRQIISKIVIPNLLIREIDEERFEDDPQEFIATDIEGSESDSRRKRSQELLRAMCRQFEAEATAICSEHVASMLSEYAADPANKWTAKDAAVHLMFGISIRAESAAHGVSQLNDAVNVMDFFTTHVFPELKDVNHAVRPMIKATSLKFVNTFRNQFTTEQLTELMPTLIAHLGSPVVVVHTYAAFAIEKILTTKEDLPDGRKKVKFGAKDLTPFLQPLFISLFAIIDNETLNENPYVMKCVMRSLNVAHENVVNLIRTVLQRLTAALARVMKNPRQPQFNHYLFESIAILVKSVCSKDPSATASFETLLFPPFQTVLQADVSEFTPYVFQVLAQLLEYRPSGSGLGEAYSSLFPPLLVPSLWERKGNIPALTRLLRAYLGNSGPELARMGHLQALLGVFQKLVASRANEVHAFDLLESVILYIPQQDVQPFLSDIFRLLLTRLQGGKSPRLARLISRFSALFVGKYDSQSYFGVLNSIQPNLAQMLLAQVWIQSVTSDPPLRTEAKIQVVGLTKILCDTPVLLNDADSLKLWAGTLAATVQLLTSAGSNFGEVVDDQDMMDEVEISYDSAFSSLQFAKKPVQDPFPEFDPVTSFAQSLNRLCSSHPGRFPPLIQEGLAADPKLSAGLEAMLKNAGVTLM